MILYLDSSALVKLYTDETHSHLVRSAASAATVRVCHDIGYVECRAALARKRNDGGLSPNDHARCVRQLDRDWDHFHIVAVTRELVLRAAMLAETRGLRAYDSVHFAAAEAVRGASLGTVDFRVGVFDTKLARAMKRGGFSLLEA